MSEITKVEICFPIPVKLPEGWDRKLSELVDQVCLEYEIANPGRIMWPSGHGSKPLFSIADAMFLGQEPAPAAPQTGEPEWDDSVYQISVAERERYETENRFTPWRCKCGGIVAGRLRACCFCKAPREAVPGVGVSGNKSQEGK